jgi:2-polyprenyl-3-methyl-5-hydroxy-6-metoxy-1,4-benzoquinol methylase
MNFDTLIKLAGHKPDEYEKSTSAFWEDEHISKGMLEAHLNPDLDAASRRLNFTKTSVKWIAGLGNTQTNPKLLDLGCGPGIYAELLSAHGFDVTGVDLSERSISYARENALKQNLQITYLHQNYLDIDYNGVFDVITLIFCDFGVLNPDERKRLLEKIHKALKPGGLFIFDVCSLRQYENRAETTSWSLSAGGYWSAEPYLCLYSFFRYDSSNTFADQYIVIEKDRIRRFNIWNHRFSVEELKADLCGAGFGTKEFYGDVSGVRYSDNSETICVVAHK